MKKLNFEKWFQTYKPIPNPIDKNGTYGEEKEFIANQDPKHIWTLVEGDKYTWIQNGAWFVNRVCYFVCENPLDMERGAVSIKYGKL